MSIVISIKGHTEFRMMNNEVLTSIEAAEKTFEKLAASMNKVNPELGITANHFFAFDEKEEETAVQTVKELIKI